MRVAFPRGTARTAADCFKFGNKIGLDVAVEALREAWASQRVSMDDLWRCAALCRVANVMRPHMESQSPSRIRSNTISHVHRQASAGI